MVTQLVNETVFEGLVNSGVLLSVIIALLIFIAKTKNSEFQKDIKTLESRVGILEREHNIHKLDLLGLKAGIDNMSSRINELHTKIDPLSKLLERLLEASVMRT